MVEISEKEYKEFKDAGEYAESIINTVREPLIVLNGDLTVVSASRAFYQVFKVKEEETERKFIYDLGDRQWDIPRLRELLEKIIPKNESFDDFEVVHDFPGVGMRTMLLNARRIPRPPAKPRVILLAIEDISARKKVEKELEEFKTNLEEIIKERTEKLELEITERKKAEEKLKEQMSELEIFNKASVGRELKMMELKKEIERLKEQIQEGKQA